MAVHDGHAGAIVAEDIVVVLVMAGEHKVQPVAYIVVTGIAGDFRFRHEFEVDAVPVSADRVLQDLQAVAFPAMNAIGGIDFVFRVGNE